MQHRTKRLERKKAAGLWGTSHAIAYGKRGEISSGHVSVYFAAFLNLSFSSALNRRQDVLELMTGRRLRPIRHVLACLFSGGRGTAT